jgi:hypothetical protein
MPLDRTEQIIEKLEELTNLLAEMNKYRFADQYLDNDEFTILLKISKKTAQLWREEGAIPYAQLGKKIYYRLSDIEELFQREFSRPKHLKKNNPQKRGRLKQGKNGNGWTIRLK